jgi:hypothetical protein
MVVVALPSLFVASVMRPPIVIRAVIMVVLLALDLFGGPRNLRDCPPGSSCCSHNLPGHDRDRRLDRDDPGPEQQLQAKP